MARPTPALAALVALLLPAAAVAQSNDYDTYGWAVVGGGCNKGLPPGASGSIRVVKQLAPDLLVLGGNFDQCYDNMTRSYAIPGTRDIALFNLTDETYSALGGGFTTVGVNPEGGLSGVYSVVQNGSDVFVAGNFQAALVNSSLTSKVPLTKGLAKWDMLTRTWASVGMAQAAHPSKAGPFGGDRGYPLALALNGSDLFAGGSFVGVYTRTGVDQPRTASIAKWNASSDQWGGIGYYGHPTNHLDRPFNGRITGIAVTGSLLLMAGDFDAFYLPSPNNVERRRGLNNDKTIDSSNGALFCQGTAYWNASSRTLGCLGGGCGRNFGGISGVTVVGTTTYWYGQFDEIMGKTCISGNGNLVNTPANAGDTAVATFNLETRQWAPFRAGVSSGSGVLVRQSTRNPDVLFMALYDAGSVGYWKANTSAYVDGQANPDSWDRLLITTFNTTSQKYQGLPYYTPTSAGTELILSATWLNTHELDDGTVYLAGAMGSATAGGNFIRSTVMPTPSSTSTPTGTPSSTSTPTGTQTSSKTSTGTSTSSKTSTGAQTSTKTSTGTSTSSRTRSPASATTTPTASATGTQTITASPSGTASVTPTASGTATETPTVSGTATSSPPPSGTSSGTATGTASATSTGSQTGTASSSATGTGSQTGTASSSSTGTGSSSASSTQLAPPSISSSATAAATASLSPGALPSSTASVTATPSGTAAASSTASATSSSTASATSSSTASATCSLSFGAPPSSSPAATASSSASSTASPSISSSASATATASATASLPPGASPSSTATATPSASPSEAARPVLALSMTLLGGSADALRESDAGVAMRAALRDLLELDAAAAVTIVTVVESSYVLNLTENPTSWGGSNVSTADGYALLGELGNYTRRVVLPINGSDALNAPLAPAALRRLQAATSCAATAMTGVATVNTTEVRFTIVMSPSYYASERAVSQDARLALMAQLRVRAVALLMSTSNVTRALRVAGMFGQWEACTDVPAERAVVAASVEDAPRPSRSATRTPTKSAAATRSVTATATTSLPPGASPSSTATATPSASPSEAPVPVLAMVIELLGGSTDSLRAGAGAALREALHDLLQLDEEIPVTITTVIETTYEVNTTEVFGWGAGNATTLARNASALGSNATAAGLGNYTRRTRVAVNASDALNASPSPDSQARRLQSAANASAAQCARSVTVGVANVTTSEVALEVEYSPAVFAALGAMTQQARAALMYELRARAQVGLGNATTVTTVLNRTLTLWEDCTGVPAEAAVLAPLTAEVVVASMTSSPSGSPAPLLVAAPPAGSGPSELNLAALIVVGLLVLLVLCCCCCLCAAWCGRSGGRGPNPLPALHATLADGRVVLLPLHWGAFFKQGGDREEEGSQQQQGARAHRELVVVIPAGAECRDQLGLRAARNAGEYDVVLPVSIVAPRAAPAGGDAGSRRMRLVRWFTDSSRDAPSCDADAPPTRGDGTDDHREGGQHQQSQLAALHAPAWELQCAGLTQLEVPVGGAASQPAGAPATQRAVLAVRVATLGERRLVLDDGHNVRARNGARAKAQTPCDTNAYRAAGPAYWGSVAPGAVLSTDELAKRLQPVVADGNAAVA